MKTASLTSYFGKFLFTVLASMAVSLVAASASQQEDQIAIQLGGLMLKVDVNSAKTSDADIARALIQGRAVLDSTVSNTKPGVSGANLPKKEDPRDLILHKKEDPRDVMPPK